MVFEKNRRCDCSGATLGLLRSVRILPLTATCSVHHLEKSRILLKYTMGNRNLSADIIMSFAC